MKLIYIEISFVFYTPIPGVYQFNGEVGYVGSLRCEFRYDVARDGAVKRALFVAICRFGLILGLIPIGRSFRKHETLRARGVFV